MGLRVLYTLKRGRTAAVLNLLFTQVGQMTDPPLDDIDISGKICTVNIMLPGVSRTICIIYKEFPGLDLYSTCADPAKHIITAAMGSV